MATQPQHREETALYISHRSFMQMQARLIEPGAEFEWIYQNAADFREWVQSFAEITQEPDPAFETVELLVVVPRRFRTVRRSTALHAKHVSGDRQE